MMYKLNGTVYSSVTFAVYLSVFSILLLLVSGPEYRSSKVPYMAETTSLDKFQNMALTRLSHITQNSGGFNPYNAGRMQICRNAIKNAKNYQNVATAFLLSPNHDLGTGAITPLNSIKDKLLFQFEQGSLGWYWGYLTFTNPICNIMFYIIRIDVGTPELRKLYNLPLGSTTAYSISFGAGHGVNSWQYSPPIITNGTYKAASESSFDFSANGDWGRVSFSGDSTTFNIDFKITSSFNKKQPFAATCRLEQGRTPPALNNPNGCSPCVAGAGTLYWSYPDLTAIVERMSINQQIIFSNLTDGDGWMDRQWLSTQPSSPLVVKLLGNLSNAEGGLGRYVWVTLHVQNPRAQYMFVTGFSPSSTINVGEVLTQKYLTYDTGKTISKQGGKLTILATTTMKNSGYGNVTFPTKISLEIEDIKGNTQKFILDSAPFGNCVTIDLTGNLHWSGSTSLNVPGSGFMEFNQFQEADDYLATTLALANIPKSNVSVFQEKHTFWQLLPSATMLTLYALTPIILIILLILMFKR